MQIPTLETPRLLLRPFRASDFEAYARAHARPEVVRFITQDQKPLDAGMAWRSMAMLVGHWELRGFGSWALEERATGAWVGRVGLHQPEPWPEVELAYMVDAPHWKKGFAKEGGRAVLDWARAQGRTRLVSYINADNAASQGVARSLGARPEGTHTVGATLCDVWVYRLTAPA